MYIQWVDESHVIYFQEPCGIHDKKLQLVQCLPTSVIPVHLQTPRISFLCIIYKAVLEGDKRDTSQHTGEQRVKETGGKNMTFLHKVK